MTAKPNQGMRSPQMGGIGSRHADFRSGAQVCRHNKPWRIPPDGKVVCGICHPPAAREVEWLNGDAA